MNNYLTVLTGIRFLVLSRDNLCERLLFNAQTEKMVTASLIIDTFKSNMVATATILDDIIVTTRSHYQPECPVFGIDTMEQYWSII